MVAYSGIFESLMLLCFGFAWPASIYRSYKARSNKGKSIFFLYIILFGYLNGVIFQYLISNNSVNYVFIIFFINIFLVVTDIALYYRNMRLMNENNNVQLATESAIESVGS